MAVSVQLCKQEKSSVPSRAPAQQQVFVSFILSLPPPISLFLWGSVTVLVWGWGPGRRAVLVTYMRDELGSCAPGSFTAVVLFYIYGAAAGPAVARCESHDSSAGNRDGPVILAPRRLHITPPALQVLLLDAHHSPQRQAVCPLTHALLHVRTHRHTYAHTQQFCSFYGHIRPSVYQDHHSRPVHHGVHI